MIIGVVARSPAPPAGPPCCGLGGLLRGLPRVGGLLRLPRGLLFRRPVVRLGPRHDRLVSSSTQGGVPESAQGLRGLRLGPRDEGAAAPVVPEARG